MTDLFEVGLYVLTYFLDCRASVVPCDIVVEVFPEEFGLDLLRTFGLLLDCGPAAHVPRSEPGKLSGVAGSIATGNAQRNGLAVGTHGRTSRSVTWPGGIL